MTETATWSSRLDQDHIQALANLVAGLTDQASAHRLGVSERTVQRRIRELMDWSGSGNRMQLGHHAALAGLPNRHRPRPEPPTVPVPDAAALRLLHLLLADLAADRLLNMSTSSVERRVRELMTLAGARSRAQLGWRATRWGWFQGWPARGGGLPPDARAWQPSSSAASAIVATRLLTTVSPPAV